MTAKVNQVIIGGCTSGRTRHVGSKVHLARPYRDLSIRQSRLHRRPACGQ